MRFDLHHPTLSSGVVTEVSTPPTVPRPPLVPLRPYRPVPNLTKQLKVRYPCWLHLPSHREPLRLRPLCLSLGGSRRLQPVRESLRVGRAWSDLGGV